MEESNRNLRQPAHLTELEKNVLDEFILDLKNFPAIIPIHEENNRARYDREKGEGASFVLLNEHMDYVIEAGEFTEDDIRQIRDQLKP
jgi:hypothetical protein